MSNEFKKYDSCPCNSQRCLLNALKDLKTSEKFDVHMHKFRICLPCKIKYDLIANTLEPQLVLTNYQSVMNSSEGIGDTNGRDKMRECNTKPSAKKGNPTNTTTTEKPRWFPTRCDTNRDPSCFSIKQKKTKSKLLLGTRVKKKGANHASLEPPLETGYSTSASSTSSYESYRGSYSKASSQKSGKRDVSNQIPSIATRNDNCEQAKPRKCKSEDERSKKYNDNIDDNCRKTIKNQDEVSNDPDVSKIYCRFSGKLKVNFQTEERYCIIDFKDVCKFIVNPQDIPIEIHQENNQCVCICEDCGPFCCKVVSEFHAHQRPCCGCSSPCSRQACRC